MPGPDTLTLKIDDPAHGARHLGRPKSNRQATGGGAVNVFAAEWGSVDAARRLCCGDHAIVAVPCLPVVENPG